MILEKFLRNSLKKVTWDSFNLSSVLIHNIYIHLEEREKYSLKSRFYCFPPPHSHPPPSSPSPVIPFPRYIPPPSFQVVMFILISAMFRFIAWFYIGVSLCWLWKFIFRANSSNFFILHIIPLCTRTVPIYSFFTLFLSILEQFQFFPSSHYSSLY